MFTLKEILDSGSVVHGTYTSRKEVGKPTGRYYFNSITKDENFAMVEVRSTAGYGYVNWYDLKNLRPIYKGLK